LAQYSWEIPEGGGPHADAALASAQRELREETGLTATNWRELQRMHLSNSVSDELALIYLATDLRNGDASPEATEDLALWHLPLQEATELVHSGAITDSLTVAGLLRVEVMQLRGEL
jgi:8-oxo-dGTP pyrophosphatase MutT (NUDIX family)